jgi:hypothetical protein
VEYRSVLICIYSELCVCGLNYPACHTHSPYCYLWPAWLYNIFPHYFINGKIFEIKKLIIKCMFWFAQQLLSDTFPHSKRKLVWYDKKNVYLSCIKCPFILDIFSKNACI